MNQEIENFKGQVREIIENAVSYVRPDEIDKIVDDLQDGRNVFIRLMPICRGDHRLVAQLEQQLRGLELPQKQMKTEENSTENDKEITPVFEESEPIKIGDFEAYYGIDHTLCLKMTSDLRMQGQIMKSDLDMAWESGRVQELVLGNETLSLELVEAKKQAFFDILKQYIKSLADMEALQEINYVDLLNQAMNTIDQEQEFSLTEEQKVVADVLKDTYQEFHASLEKKFDGNNQDLLALITSLKTLESNYIHFGIYDEQAKLAMLDAADLSLEELTQDLTRGRLKLLTILKEAYKYLDHDLHNLDELVDKGLGLDVFNYNLKNLKDSYYYIASYSEDMLEQMLAQFNMNVDEHNQLDLEVVKSDLDKAQMMVTSYEDMEEKIGGVDLEILGILEVLKSRDDLNEHNQEILKHFESIFSDHMKGIPSTQDTKIEAIKANYQDHDTIALLRQVTLLTLSPDDLYDKFLGNLEDLGLNIDRENDQVLMNESLRTIYNTLVEAYEQTDLFDMTVVKENDKEQEDKQSKIEQFTNQISSIANEKEDLSKVSVEVEEDVVSTLGETIDVIDMESPKYQEFLQDVALKNHQLEATKFRKLKIPMITAFNVFSKKRKEMKKYNASVDLYNEYQKAHTYTETYGQYFDLSEKDQIEVKKGKDVLEAWKHDLEEMSGKYQQYVIHGNTPKLEESKGQQGKPINVPKHAANNIKKEHERHFDAEVEQMKQSLQTKKDVELIEESKKLNKKVHMLEQENKELLTDRRVDLLELVSLIATYKSKTDKPSKEIRAISKETRGLYEELIQENKEDADTNVKLVENQIDSYQNTSLEEIEQLILEENQNLKQTLSNLQKNEVDHKNTKILSDLALHTAIKKGAENDFKDFSKEDKQYIHEVKTFDSDFSKFVNKYAQNKLDVYVDEKEKNISDDQRNEEVEKGTIQSLPSGATYKVTEVEKNEQEQPAEKEFGKKELEAIRAYLNANGSSVEEIIAAGSKLMETEAQIEEELKEGRSR